MFRFYFRFSFCFKLLLNLFSLLSHYLYLAKIPNWLPRRLHARRDAVNRRQHDAEQPFVFRRVFRRLPQFP